MWPRLSVVLMGWPPVGLTLVIALVVLAGPGAVVKKGFVEAVG